MYCQNCGQELSEDAQFCNYCGAQQNQTDQQQTQQYQAQSTQQYTAPSSMPDQPPYQPQYQPQANMPYNQTGDVKPKNKIGKKIIISIAVIAVALVVGRLIGAVVMAPSMSGDADTKSTYTGSIESTAGDNKTDNETSANPSSSAVNSEYAEIFASRNIVESYAPFLMLDSASFAKVEEDGMVIKEEYGYKNDLIKEMVITIYQPISDYTDAEKIELDKNLRQEFSEFEALDICTIEYSQGNNYYNVTVTYKDLDNLENIKTLCAIDALEVDANDGLLSMQKTEESLLSDGYVKK